MIFLTRALLRCVPIMVQLPEPTLRVVFYRGVGGREPVREWLRSLDRESRKALGEDIETVQYLWPVGMPLVRNLGDGLWEIRSRLEKRIARVVFVVGDDLMVLLLGFVKKSRRTPKPDLDLARRRAVSLRKGEME